MILLHQLHRVGKHLETNSHVFSWRFWCSIRTAKTNILITGEDQHTQKHTCSTPSKWVLKNRPDPGDPNLHISSYQPLLDYCWKKRSTYYTLWPLEHTSTLLEGCCSYTNTHTHPKGRVQRKGRAQRTVMTACFTNPQWNHFIMSISPRLSPPGRDTCMFLGLGIQPTIYGLCSGDWSQV